MAGGGGGEEVSLEYTPTWVVALVCTVIVAISLAAERILHYTGKFLINKKQGPLFDALLKIKEDVKKKHDKRAYLMMRVNIDAELMLLGFISLLLTVFQERISTICIAKHLTNHWLPCKRETEDDDDGGGGGKSIAHLQSSFLSFLVPGGGRRLLATASDAADRCEKEGKAPLLSLKALHDLHIFIFVLALVHVVISALTILFGSLKVRKLELHMFTSMISSGPVFEFVTFQNHYRDNPKFNFYKYMVRAFEADFKKVVGISWYLWVFVVVFLLLNVGGWHAYFYIAFIPLILLVGVGTKLEHIITQLAEEVAQKHVAVTGDLVVKPSDHHFWFRKPRLVLVLIHVILFQNSFEIAVFFWMLFLCSYSTLPLYAIVAQMGSSFNKAIFEEHIQVKLTGWAHKAKRNKGQRKAVGGGSTQTGNNESPSPVPSEVLVQESTLNEGRSLEIETITVSYDPK
ncbi:hypothetical protein DH2020_004905 [Rehmannia glutinosa]|uniref:MLO-like protein n=1 Tax=Rehmannia glutinosa TaxID=99300 RepID=A0ABR0XQT2_REHGL